MSNKHAECSPSQLSRIMACPGSRRLLRDFKKSSSSYADEGTMLHIAVELELRAAYNTLIRSNVPDALVCDRDEVFANLTREQKTAVEECVEYFESLVRELQLISEIKSIELEAATSLEWCDLPEVSGYVDLKIMSDRRLDIVDWKFGQGVPVSPVDNNQLKGYAGGSLQTPDEWKSVDEIHLHIVQPRLDSMSSWMISADDLRTWIFKDLTTAIEASRKEDAECIPGEMQCRWCVGPTCRVRAKKTQETASIIFEKYVKKELLKNDFIDPGELSSLLKDAKMVSTFIKELTGIALEKCISGDGFPGYKAVAGRSSRKWRDQQDAETWLLEQADDPKYKFEFEDLYETKFVSVAKAEKLDKSFKKATDFKELFYKTAGKPTLVLESDPRKAISSRAEAVFKDYAKKD